LNQLIDWLLYAAHEADPDNAPRNIAGIIAGWYFVLTPSGPDEPGAPAETGDTLTAKTVRALLLSSAARHCSRRLRNSLLERWAEMKSDILEEVIQLEALASYFNSASVSSDLMSSMSLVRSRVFSATLLPIGTRGASTAAQLSPPPNTEVLELKLVITGESYRTYSAEIQKPAFAVDFTITDLTIEIVEGSKAVVLRLPQRFFDEGEFRVLLRGMTSDNKMEDIGEYVFQTRR